jgi:ACS family allantoate permease-like MFS transporter
MPGGFLQIFTNIGIPYLSSKYKIRSLGAAFGLFLALLGISLMAGLAIHNPINQPVGQLIGYYILIGSPGITLILLFSSVSSNTAGYTKKTTTNAVTLIGYCVGFLIGPQTFIASDGPYYYHAKYNTIAQWIFSFFLCILLYFINRRENAKRDREFIEAGSPPQTAGQEFLDLTDKENRYFRYAL